MQPDNAGVTAVRVSSLSPATSAALRWMQHSVALPVHDHVRLIGADCGKVLSPAEFSIGLNDPSRPGRTILAVYRRCAELIEIVPPAGH